MRRASRIPLLGLVLAALACGDDGSEPDASLGSCETCAIVVTRALDESGSQAWAIELSGPEPGPPQLLLESPEELGIGADGMTPWGSAMLTYWDGSTAAHWQVRVDDEGRLELVPLLPDGIVHKGGLPLFNETGVMIWNAVTLWGIRFVDGLPVDAAQLSPSASELQEFRDVRMTSDGSAIVIRSKPSAGPSQLYQTMIEPEFGAPIALTALPETSLGVNQVELTDEHVVYGLEPVDGGPYELFRRPIADPSAAPEPVAEAVSADRFRVSPAGRWLGAYPFLGEGSLQLFDLDVASPTPVLEIPGLGGLSLLWLREDSLAYLSGAIDPNTQESAITGAWVIDLSGPAPSPPQAILADWPAGGALLGGNFGPLWSIYAITDQAVTQFGYVDVSNPTPGESGSLFEIAGVARSISVEFVDPEHAIVLYAPPEQGIRATLVDLGVSPPTLRVPEFDDLAADSDVETVVWDLEHDRVYARVQTSAGWRTLWRSREPGGAVMQRYTDELPVHAYLVGVLERP